VNVQDCFVRFQRFANEIGKVLVGQDEVVEHVLYAILARGHVLIEGAPGLGKTLLVRAMGQALGCTFRRIQFTPDLMPSDVTGGNVFNPRAERSDARRSREPVASGLPDENRVSDSFEFHAGPVFTQLLLADEVNRAPAKTQSALLEAMQESAVTVDGVTRPLPRPFFVIATQNPIESQGTYPLPEAQLDRFLFKLEIHHPARDAERQVLRNHLGGFDSTALKLDPVVTTAELLEMQQALQQVRVEDGILDYITEVVGKTRAHRSIGVGASTRASIALGLAARARAAGSGRDFVVPDDVKALAFPVLRHRILLHPDAELEGLSPDTCIEEILRETTVPHSAAA
jgi:MoxR-like ATPase